MSFLTGGSHRRDRWRSQRHRESKENTSGSTAAWWQVRPSSGANLFKDLFAGIRDIVGGRSRTTKRTLRRREGYRASRTAAAGPGGGGQRRRGCRPRLRGPRPEQRHAHGVCERNSRRGRVGKSPDRASPESRVYTTATSWGGGNASRRAAASARASRRPASSARADGSVEKQSRSSRSPARST